MKKSTFGFENISETVHKVSDRMKDKLVGETRGGSPRTKKLFTKKHTTKYSSGEENLEYEVEVKLQVSITPIFTTPRRDASICRYYDQKSDICSEIGCKCNGRCVVDCLYFESKDKKNGK